jgi:hypothetical protein
MSDDKSKRDGRDRSRVSLSEPYEVESFHRKHKHLSHEQAIRSSRKRAVTVKKPMRPLRKQSDNPKLVLGRGCSDAAPSCRAP